MQTHSPGTQCRSSSLKSNETICKEDSLASLEVSAGGASLLELSTGTEMLAEAIFSLSLYLASPDGTP